MASQITSLTIVYSTVYSSSDQRKHQSSASLAFVRVIHRWPVNSSHKWSVTRKMFPFDGIIMWFDLGHKCDRRFANTTHRDRADFRVSNEYSKFIYLVITFYWSSNVTEKRRRTLVRCDGDSMVNLKLIVILRCQRMLPFNMLSHETHMSARAPSWSSLVQLVACPLFAAKLQHFNDILFEIRAFSLNKMCLYIYIFLLQWAAGIRSGPPSPDISVEQVQRVRDLHLISSWIDSMWLLWQVGMILGLRPASERRCYLVTTSLICWAQT